MVLIERWVYMETYVDIFLNTDGEKASLIGEKLLKIGLKSSMGEHDYIYDWKRIVAPSEIIELAEKIQTELKGTGVFIKLYTIR
jgi:hypothetical protein